MSRPLEKADVAQLLEATKCYLDHVRRWQMDVSEGRRVPQVPRELASLYGSVRRLKDHLQRIISTFPLPESLDLDTEDLDLLGGCVVHYIGQLESRDLSDQRLPPSERQWFAERVRVLAAWIDRHASPAFDRLPCSDPVQFATSAAKEVLGRARTRRAGLTDRPSGFVRFRGADFGDGGQTDADHQQHSGREAVTGAGGMALGRELPAHALSTEATSEPPALAPAFAPTSAGPAASRADGLFEPQLIREPRLRAIASMDLAALERALAAQDHRMSTIHYSSLAETLIVDHALHRRVELGLQGGPETWKLEELVVRLLDGRTSAMEKGFLGHLLATRTLLAPATQIHAPVVVTQQTVNLAREFVKHLLHQLGYHGQTRSGLLRAVR